MVNDKWYGQGLHFECEACGNCCKGPEEGYIWATKKELSMIAKELGITIEQLKKKYTQKVGNDTTLVEEQETKDCIFLKDKLHCEIYSVRPNQCRTWPFWNMNLGDVDDWNMAATRCPGINRGRLYSFEEIEEIRNQKCWWDGKDCGPSTKK